MIESLSNLLSMTYTTQKRFLYVELIAFSVESINAAALNYSFWTAFAIDHLNKFSTA